MMSSHQVQVEHTRASSVLEISSDESGNEMAGEAHLNNSHHILTALCPEATPRKRQKRVASPKYRLEVRHTASGEIFELCTDNEGEI